MSTPPTRRPKFSLQKTTQDFTSHVRHIAESTLCKKHKRSIGQPCWWLHTDNGLKAGLCNQRVKQMYDGSISEQSFNRKRPKKVSAA